MQDHDIIALYFARSEQAIRESSAKYGNYCLSIAQNILRSLQDAEECVNDTWLRAWNSIPPARPDHLQLYLGGITRHLSLDRYRKLHRDKRGGGEMVLALDEMTYHVNDGAMSYELTMEFGDELQIVPGDKVMPVMYVKFMFSIIILMFAT